MEVAPIAVEKVPMGQPVHVDCPAAEYVPAAHVEHVEMEVAPSAAEKVPAAHIVQSMAPIPEKVPAAQAVQGVDPVAERVPLGQRVSPSYISHSTKFSMFASAPLADSRFTTNT